MKRKSLILLLLVLFGSSGLLIAQTSDEVTLSVKLISAECFEGCTYDFEDVSTGEKILLSWNTIYDEKKYINTFPDLDDESAKIMYLIERCAESSYDERMSDSYCNEVLGKTFFVQAEKKTRQEVKETAPMTWEKTGKIETYYEIKNISNKNNNSCSFNGTIAEYEKIVLGTFADAPDYIEKYFGDIIIEKVNNQYLWNPNTDFFRFGEDYIPIGLSNKTDYDFCIAYPENKPDNVYHFKFIKNSNGKICIKDEYGIFGCLKE